MKRIKIAFAVSYAAALLFMVGCTNKNYVKIENRNFEEEVELRQNLVFTFSKDLVDDSLLNRWDSTQLIEITPQVNGLFKWNTRRELMFSPEKGFMPATAYKAVVTKKIFSKSLEHLSLDENNSFDFHTPFLALENMHGHWTRASAGSEALNLLVSVTFNYKVPVTHLTQFAKLTIDGKQSQFTLNSSDASDEAILIVSGFTKSDLKKVNVQLRIGEGMPCSESSTKTSKPLELTTEVPLPDQLNILNATGEYNGTQPVIHVFTNQAVDETNISQFIKVDPKINFSTETAADGFLVKAAFDPGQTYQLTLFKNLKGLIGGALQEDFSAYVPFGEMQPSVSFTSANGMYLSSKSSKNIGISLVNVPKVRVTIYKLYENNILAFMRQNRYEYYDYDYSEDGSSGGARYNIYGIENFGDVAFQRDYDTKNLAKSNGANLLNISMDEINSFKGVYVVSVASQEDYWLRATKLIALSDIGLIAKQTDDEIVVFANSIKTAEPAAGVSVSFVSSNNQVLFTTTTDGDGKATYADIKNKAKNFSVSMITSRSGSDYNMLMFSDSRVETSRYDIGGRYDNAGGYMAYVYGDRDIYRPGETVYLNAIVRNDKWMPLPDMPVKFKCMLPNGNEFKTMRQVLTKQGAAAISLPLPQGAVTGNYVVDVFTANDILIGSKNVYVEEFMPDRIDVKLTAAKPEFVQGDTVKASVLATNFFGPPAAHRNYEFEFNLSRKYFYSKDFPDYNFSVHTENEIQFEKKVEQGQTDDKGEATAKFPIPASYENLGVLQGKLFATVFDETGRPVNRMKTFNIYTQNVFYGIKLDDYYASRGKNMIIGLASCNKDGKAVKSTAKVEIINYDWYNVVEKNDNGTYRYVSHKKEISVFSKTVSIDQKGYNLNFVPNYSGEYEVRISDVNSGNYVESNFWAYGYGYTQNTSFNINTEGQVTIQADKDTFAPGEKANLLFKTPFAGKLLVTVESNKLIKHYYLNTDKRSAMLSLPVEDSFLPNVYISATLFKPLDDGSIPLTVAHGYLPLIVNKPDLRIPVSIECPEKSRSKTKQTIKVKTGSNRDVEVTIAVVDEGILALKNQKTPDPFSYFYQKRALQVNSFDVYANLLPDLKIKRSVTGGDEGFDLSRRVNPLTNKRVQLVALWSGIIRTNSAGEASYTIDIPQFSGDLRVMACAWSGNRFGSTDKHMKVADPIVISPSIPRFLSPGDTLVMPVTLSNTTSGILQADATCNVDGNLKLLNAPSQKISIQPGSEANVTWQVMAKNAIGQGEINIIAKTAQESFADKTNITIRPPASLIKETSSGICNSGNNSVTIASDFIPSSTKVKLLVSNSPLVQFSDQLSYLLDYPHGCLEQTASIAFPQIYYSDLAKTITTKTNFVYDAHYNVQEAIRKIESMQIYNGSLSYWPGSVIENWWATTYALHFLTEAQKAGYDVNQNTIDRTFEYLKTKTKSRETDNYYFLGSNNIISKSSNAKREIIYSLYLMALNGKQDLSSMNYYKANTALLTLDSRYMLATAYMALGDTKSYYALLPEKFDGPKSVTSNGGCFYSYIRDYALSLNCLLETDPNNAQIPEMARTLSQQIKSEQYLNTQERAFAFLALGKFVKRNVNSNVTGTISVDGKSLATYAGKDVVLTDKNLIGKKLDVVVNGTGNLYYFLEVNGIKEGLNFKEEDSHLRVRKSFFNRFGQPLGNNIRQGEMIVVKLSLVATDGVEVDNVVLTDMIPSGFEIENPRITDEREMLWIKDKYEPTYFDIRDDRINLYVSAWKSVKSFYYTVRAVNTGNFVMGPVSADAMYNGEYHSYNGSGWVKIVK